MDDDVFEKDAVFLIDAFFLGDEPRPIGRGAAGDGVAHRGQYGFATTFIERPPHLPYKAVETILAQMAEKDPKVKEHKADEFIDPTFYNELDKSGFFKNLGN